MTGGISMAIKKRLALVGATVLMALSSFSMLNASADVTGVEDLVTFEWGPTHARTINESDVTRYMEAGISIYNKSTGNFICNFFDNTTGGQGVYAQAFNNTYSSVKYNIGCWGTIYNGNVSASGTAWYSDLRMIIS